MLASDRAQLMNRPRQSGSSTVWSLISFATLALFAATLYTIFVVAPVEQQMGIVQKIFYFHVPSAYAMYIGFGVSAVGSAVVSSQARPQVGRPRSRRGRSRLAVLSHRFAHRSSVGPQGLGRLVDVGPPTHDDAVGWNDLRRVPLTSIDGQCRRSREAIRSRPRAIWGRGPAADSLQRTALEGRPPDRHHG